MLSGCRSGTIDKIKKIKVMKNVVKRKAGRPVGSKKKVIVNSNVVSTWKPELVKMDDLSFDKDLFIPMPTGKKIDELLSSEGGLMRGTNTALIGDPGVGKTTVVLDILADLKAKGQKVLFISGEMNSIDMHGYCLLYTSPSPRDRQKSRMPSSA